MAKTKIDACNMALAHLGQSKIQNLLEKNPSSRFCNLFFDAVLEAVLSDYTWSFATKFSDVLAEVSGETTEYSYVYSIPSDILLPIKLVIVNESDASEIIDWSTITKNEIAYEIIGDYLHTNESNVKLLYIFKNENTAKQNSIFYIAFSYKLASMLAMPLTNKKDLKVTMEQFYQAEVAKARAADTSTDRTELRLGYDLVDARD